MSSVLVTLSDTCPNVELLDVLEDNEKSLKLRNRDNGATCFVPKSGLRNWKGRVDEFVLAPWFRSKLNHWQERALGVSE